MSNYQDEVLYQLGEIAANTHQELTEDEIDNLQGQRYYQERIRRKREKWRRTLHVLEKSKWRAAGACPLHDQAHLAIQLINPTTGCVEDELCPHTFWIRCSAIVIQRGLGVADWLRRHPWGCFVRDGSAK